MKNFFNRYGLILFFPLTYLLSWWIVPLLNGGLFPQGPAFAAFILVALTAGRQGLRAYWRQITNWRAGWWYLVAPLIVIGYEGIAFVLSLMSGAKLAGLPHLSMGTFMMLVLFGGQWEELGWTGYALPRLRERFANRSNGSLIAVLVLGVFRALWHLPLFLYGKMDWFDIFIFSFSFQIIIAWLYDRSGESVPVVVTLHFVSNIMGAAMPFVFLGADQVMFRFLFVAVASIFALMLVAFPQFKVQQQKAEAM